MIARVECPVLGIFGEADHVISLADVRRFRDSLDRHDKTYTVKVYPGAPHGWLNDTMPGRYRRDIAEAVVGVPARIPRQSVRRRFRHVRAACRATSREHAAGYDFAKNVRLA